MFLLLLCAAVLLLAPFGEGFDLWTTSGLPLEPGTLHAREVILGMGTRTETVRVALLGALPADRLAAVETVSINTARGLVVLRIQQVRTVVQPALFP